MWSNAILNDNNWDPSSLSAPEAKWLPATQYDEADKPYGIGREVIVDVPINSFGKFDVYIDDTIGLTVDILGSQNAMRLENAALLTIHTTARPLAADEPIPKLNMVARSKLTAEGGLSKSKVILRWLFDFRSLTVSLPLHKYTAWKNEITKVILK